MMKKLYELGIYIAIAYFTVGLYFYWVENIRWIWFSSPVVTLTIGILFLIHFKVTEKHLT